jgi:hypothetical protein
VRNFISVLLALLAAALVPLTIFTIPMIIDLPKYLAKLYGHPTHEMYLAEYQRAARVWCIAFITAFAHAIVFGLPTYFLLRKKNLARWWASGLCGFIIGCIPFAILTFPFGPSNHSFSADGIPMIVNGVPTLVGWKSYIEGTLKFGGYGLSGGLAAWCVWYLASSKRKASPLVTL